MSDYNANKRIVKNTAYLYLRMLLNLIISLYTSRAILDALGVEDYGIYNIVAGFVSMISIFTNSITSAATRFITVELGNNDLEKRRITYSTIMIIVGVISLIILLLGEIVGLFFLDKIIVIPPERIASARFVFHCSVLVFIVNFLSVPNTALVTAHEKMDFFAVISVGQSLAKLLIVFLLYITTFDRLRIYALLLLFIDITIRIIYGIYCSHHFEESHFRWTFKKSVFREVFGYSVWATIGSSSAVLKEQGVNVLINMFFGVVMNAARGISMQVYGIVDQFSRNIGMAISPQIMKSYSSGEKKRAVNLTIVQGKAQGILLLFLSLPIFLETDYILGLWLKEVPEYANLFTKWVLILCLFRTLENTHTPIFLANGNIKVLNIVAGGIMLMNIPISYIFLKIGYQPVVTMIIGSIIEILCTVVIFFYLKHLIGFPAGRFFNEVFFPIISISILSCVIPLYIINHWQNACLLRLFITASISVLSVSSLSFIWILKKEERHYLLAMVKKKLFQR